MKSTLVVLLMMMVRLIFIHFVHEDPVDGDVKIIIVGQNTSGFTLQFALMLKQLLVLNLVL